ncbi:snare-like protein [Nadsonia fulvescens var. elongata DSM 6958]|uniref:Trafficking protein particle complex subunit n=1 Tax=Nadsonia fulvescens var. elongata DSM 6958 TaxID=857566 RepID=A0A1E3PKT8_9ASCO|nr:snare-like protein [Nadsonia fulvescens var. elongata DSM 6958]
MTIYNLYIFDRHCSCIFHRQWHGDLPEVTASSTTAATRLSPLATNSHEDNVKLVFGSVFSLRNMTQKLTLDGQTNAFVSFQTSKYKLHYYEPLSGIKMVMLTDPQCTNLKQVLQQIYAGLYVEFVVKNPLSPLEYLEGEQIDNEFFVAGLDLFVRGLPVFE